jgi:hypothetical protein
MKLFFLEKPSDGWFWHPMANRVAPKTRLTVPINRERDGRVRHR